MNPSITLDPVASLLGAVVVLLIGTQLNRRIGLLSRYNIPDPITGGVLFALVASVAWAAFDFRLAIDQTLKPLLLLMFFAGVGMTADLRQLKRGGRALVIFLIANTVPGDPVLSQLGDMQASDPAIVAEFRKKWGLDLPIWDRYWIFLRGLVQGDLGMSLTQRPISQMLADAWPITIKLALLSVLISAVIAVSAGVLSGIRRGGVFDNVTLVITLIVLAMPIVVLAPPLQPPVQPAKS